MDRSRTEPSGAAVAIGTFDGLHRGHQFLIGRLLDVAARNGLAGTVLTLSAPVRHVSGLLTTVDEKIGLLREYPVDSVAVLPNSPEVTVQTAGEFFRDTLLEGLAARYIVVGEDFTFGHGRKGNVSWLAREAPRAGVGLEVVPPVLFHGEVISSSRIRHLLSEGRVDYANRLLGRYYQLEGEQVPGRGVGRQLGFPTVNMRVPDEKIVPKGVFAGIVARGRVLRPAVVNIGNRPTFDLGDETAVEINLLDFHGTWPPGRFTLYLCHHIRNERKFSSVSSLKARIGRDVGKAREFFGI